MEFSTTTWLVIVVKKLTTSDWPLLSKPKPGD